MTISIKVESLVGDNIPGSVIPDMVRLANKLGIDVEARDLNGVIVIAKPGDDELHLAVAWRRALSSKQANPIAFASDGKALLERP